MGLLDRFKHKKPNMARNQLVSDANCLLEILRNTLNLTSCSWDEIVQKWTARKGLEEERLCEALLLLGRCKLIGWNGKGSHVGFNKRALPLELPPNIEV